MANQLINVGINALRDSADSLQAAFIKLNSNLVALDKKAERETDNVFTGSNRFNALTILSSGLQSSDVSNTNQGGSLKSRINSGFWQCNIATPDLGYPANGWTNVIAATHSNDTNNFSLQIAAPFFQNLDFFVRSTNNDGNTPWNKLWHSGNFDPQNQLFNGQMRMWAETAYDTNKSRIKIERVNESNEIFADLYVRRDTTNAAPGTGGTSSMVRIEQIVGEAKTYQWPLLVKMEINGRGPDANHVCITNQMYATKDAGFYGMCGENRDGWENPSTASVAFELDLFGKGGDNSGNRVMLDCVYGAYYPLLKGDHTINCGIRISPLQNVPNWFEGQSYPDGFANPTTNAKGETINPDRGTGRALMRYGMQMKGNIGTGIDLSQIRQDYSNEGIYFANGQFMKWGNGAILGSSGSSFVISAPDGGLGPGMAMPSEIVATMLVNVGGVGLCRVPLIRA